MSAHDWQKVEDLLHQAMALASEQRAEFLDVACGSDVELRAELNSLLIVGDDLSDEFLNSPLRGVLDRQIGEIDSASTLVAGQIFAQRFELIRKLGEGGMGQVWLAEQTSPVRRQVAVKLIKAGMYDEAVVQRFQSERQSLAIMDHPAIAKVFDAGTTPQGQPYLVMEYVPGLPITDYCDQHKLKVKDRLELFIHACEGVQHAHQKAIIHRDLKPSNILVIEVDGKAVPRIIDFGLAKTTAPQVSGESLFTQLGQFIGTPGYMSPEQVSLSAGDIDTRTDVYTLGVVLYVLLTGLQPFETKRREKTSLEEWLRQLREEEPPNPSTKVSGDKDTSSATAGARGTEPKQLISQLRGDLDWIAMKALERDRTRRYATPSELAADLRRYLNDEPVTARPASTLYQLRKFVRRHRVGAVVACMAAVLLMAVATAGLIAIRQKHEAEFQATQALQAQSRLLTQAAAQRLKDSDVEGAQGIILEVLTNPEFAQAPTPAAISVFQDIRAADAQLAVLSGHGDAVYSAAYSPDGSRIVTASIDKTARIWDARTGAELVVISGPAGAGDFAAYSPDGTRIVTASDDKTARIWDARTGAQLAVLSGHADYVVSAAYSPDGSRIVTTSYDKTARIWDARTAAQLAVLSGHGDRINSAAYSPDGSRIVTASADKTARIWDARTGAQLAVLSGQVGPVNSAAFSPDGAHIVTAFNDKTARIWDARTGAQLAVLSGHDRINFAAYSPDGSRIVTASDDTTARIWDARTAAELAVLSGHSDRVDFAAYSPDGSRILTASGDKTARIWDARISATLAAQILWNAAAQTDPLPEVDRTELGLRPDARVRQWGTEGSACDEAAAAFYDPDRLTPGLAQAAIAADVANSACSPQLAPSGHTPRLAYQAARALLAKSDVKGSRQQFELAVSAGHRAAQVDLADLLVNVKARMLDPGRAISLYETAWKEQVPIAAFRLGHFYEYGWQASDAAGAVAFHADASKAWQWYQKGADAGEPNALARFAERDETSAIAEEDVSRRNALLLRAFTHYAAAAEYAHREDWPDDAWKNWRYRRATLARLLAREGMMQQVADAYSAILEQPPPPERTWWKRIKSRLNL